jgi:hypothetical protein
MYLHLLLLMLLLPLPLQHEFVVLRQMNSLSSKLHT